jgi:hypothetical protein
MGLRGAGALVPGPRARGSTFRLAAVCALVAALGVLMLAARAEANIQHEFLVFSDCPVNAPEVSTCIVSTVSSGEFHIGSKAVPINKTIVLQGGLSGSLASSTLVSAVDGNTLSKTPLVVPGGLLGVELLPPLTEVTATAEIAGPVNGVHVFLENAVDGHGTAVALPLKVKLDNPALGSECYIGSDAGPVSLELTTGTTSPPPPNVPISGKRGNLLSNDVTKILTITENSLVDNSFSAPGVNGCGGLLALLVDPSVDLAAGLPAAGGHNTAILNGSIELANSSTVSEQAAAPEFGRCEKVASGHFATAECLVRAGGRYEWMPGAGSNHKFTSTGGSAVLEMSGGTKLKCASSAGSGEYTGTKTADLTVRFFSCHLAPGTTPCRSPSASAGEIVTSPLTGELGFIQDTEGPEKTIIAKVGIDFKGSPSLATVECGSQTIVIGGSVIAPISPLEKMTSEFAVKFSAAGGKQLPEAFEEAEKDTLTTIIKSGSSEVSGTAAMTGTIKLHNEEKLAIKAFIE